MVGFSKEELEKLESDELEGVITIAEDILSERESGGLFDDEEADDEKKEEKQNKGGGKSGLLDEDLGLPQFDFGLGA